MRAALMRVGEQLGPAYPLIIGGERRETGEWITSINPGNLDQVVGEVAKARASDVEDAIAAAEWAFKTWRKMPAEGRASVLFKMAAIIRRRKLELAAWMVYELDKAWDEAEGEVCEAVDFLEWYGRQALKLDQPVDLAHIPDEANEMRYFPIGIGVVISPWNFPCAILTGMTMAPVVGRQRRDRQAGQQHPDHRLQDGRDHGGGRRPAGRRQFPARRRRRDRRSAGRSPAHPLRRLHRLERRRHPHLRARREGAAGPALAQAGHRRDGRQGRDHRRCRRRPRRGGEGIVTSAFGFSGQKCSACSRAIVHADVYDEIVERCRRADAAGT